MGRRRCCCTGCTIFDSTYIPIESLPGYFTVLSGDWELKDSADPGMYYMAETSGTGKIVSNVEHPIPDQSGWLRIRLEVPWEVGAKMIVRLGCKEDGTGGNRLTIEATHVDTLSAGIPTGPPYGLKAWLNDDTANYWTFPNVYANQQSGTYALLCYTGEDEGAGDGALSGDGWMDVFLLGSMLQHMAGPDQRARRGGGTDTEDGWYIAIENASPGTQDIGIREVRWVQHCSTNPVCPICHCHCDGKEIPHGTQFTLTLYSDCPFLDGMEIPLINESDGFCGWKAHGILNWLGYHYHLYLGGDPDDYVWGGIGNDDTLELYPISSCTSALWTLVWTRGLQNPGPNEVHAWKTVQDPEYSDPDYWTLVSFESSPYVTASRHAAASGCGESITVDFGRSYRLMDPGHPAGPCTSAGINWAHGWCEMPSFTDSCPEYVQFVVTQNV